MKALSTKSRTVLKRITQLTESNADAKWYSVHDVLKIVVKQPISAEEYDEMVNMGGEDDDLESIASSNKTDAIAEAKDMMLLLDDLVLRDYLERRELPEVQYRRVMKAKPWPVNEVREIQKQRSAKTVVSGFGEEGVVLMDQTTAALLIKIYDSLSPTNQAKFATRDVVEATHLAWKLVQKGAVSVSFQSS